LPNVTPLPQYSQVITISPNFGAMGAPQLGHFIEVTPDGAIIVWLVDDGSEPEIPDEGPA
jgi:hypothetical protein